MDWSSFIRQGHRWLSIVFTATIFASFAAMGLGGAPEWLFYLPLPPLFMLMGTGIYMFVMPYARRRAARAPRERG